MIETQTPAGTPEDLVPVGSEIPAEEAAQQQQGASDTPVDETPNAETDEQKNAREIEEKRKRDERKAQGLQKRFNELTAEKYAERARAEAAERRLQQIEAEFRQRAQAPQQQSDDPPQRQQFGDYEDYIAARSRYEARQEALQIARRFDEAQKAQSLQMQAARQAQTIQERFEERLNEFRKSTPDFEEVVMRDDVVVPDHVAADIVKADTGPAIMYAIGKDPSIVDKLARMEPFERALQIGKLSAMLGRSPQVSNAPAPGKPVGVRPGTSATEPPTDPDAYMAWAKKHMR